MKRYTLILLVFFASSIQSAYSQVDSSIAPYNYKHLGSIINSESAELNPVVAADESILFFVREEKGKYSTSQYIWSAERDENNNWMEAKKESKPFNTMPVNSIADIINDGRTVLIKGNYQFKEVHPRGFSLIEKVNGKWSNPVGLNIEEYESLDKGLYNNATISFDRKVLIFSFSEEDGGKHNNLYISFQTEGVNYTKPVKLPAPLNIDGHSEFAPRISPDGKKLYFSSDRPGGLGSIDIYVSERLDDSWMKWSSVENMSNIVNTPGRDSYFSIDSIGEYAYIVSDVNTLGRTDIFQVKLTTPHIITGVLADKRTNKNLTGTVHITSPKSDDLISVSEEGYEKIYNVEGAFIVKCSADGYYERLDTITIKRSEKAINLVHKLEKIPVNRKVRITVQDDKGKSMLASVSISKKLDTASAGAIKVDGLHEAMLTEGKTYTITATDEVGVNTQTKTFEVPFAADGDTIIPAVAFTFKSQQILSFVNLHFHTNSDVPVDSSLKYMDLVVDYMNNNPEKEVIISAHTDDVGSSASNLDLSKRRAATVKKYIVSKGIDESRLKSVGYGEKKPLKSGKTEEIRAINRRVEFELAK